MAQEIQRAGRVPVSAGLKDDDEVADVDMRQLHFVADDIEWGAKRADYSLHFEFVRKQFVADGDRIVFANDLTEVTGGGKVMMQSAVRDQVRNAPGDLAVDDSAHI